MCGMCRSWLEWRWNGLKMGVGGHVLNEPLGSQEVGVGFGNSQPLYRTPTWYGRQA